ncbi:MoaD/ThiS family protein [Acinetobacter sp. YH12144]|uniref:MoaD/ThiS family protein n=1 Tax=Acinetobacter sp. YH12144 TaxID=2601128 RepID=UPI00211EDF15|nr:MoaD/ThiS family protein [Acinetobacter sp. YH12144]
MTHITIKIESFGAIERLLPENLSLTCFAQQSIAEVLQQVTDQFPESFSMLERCACAMGEDIVPRQTALMHDDLIKISHCLF